MERRGLIILTALELEARAVAGALGLAYTRGTGARSTDSRFPIELHAVGIGARRLPPLEARPGVWVVMAGLAGGLNPSLACGDLVVDVKATPWRWPACATANRFAVRSGTILTAAAVVASVREKAELFARTAAAAVEMEGDIVRAAAEAAGLPFLQVRAISDATDEAIDPAVLRFVDDLGRPRVGSLGLGLLRRPTLIPVLRRLQAASSLANHNLGVGVGQIVQCLFHCGCCLSPGA